MKYLTLIPLFFLSLCASVQAAGPSVLYQAEVEVPDKGAEARAEGMGQAMLAVMRKVAGSDRVFQHQALADAAGHASRYVQQYLYRTEAEAEEGSGRDSEKRLLMVVRFDPNGIDTLLRDNGFVVWGATRPVTLVWLAVEQSGQRILVGDNDGGAVRDYLAEAAERRALTLQLPLLDLRDRSRVQAADIWGEFIEPVQEASERYTHQALLLGRLYPLGGGNWQVKWTLSYQGEMQRWQNAGSVEGAIDAGVGQTAEFLLEQFNRGLSGGSGTMRLAIQGISGLEDYRRVLDYLSAIHGVSSVQTEQVTHNAARFRVQAEGGLVAVQRIIALGDLLEPVVQRQTMPALQRGNEPELPPGAATPVQPETGAVPAESPVVSVSPDAVYRLVP